MQKYPNFFIVGAPKAGTSSIYEYLKDIPEIFMSPIKEPNYFSKSTMSEEYPINIIRDKIEYLSLFDKVKDEKIIGEATTSYLSDVDAPIQIHKMFPNARILISLRDPVERAFSHYLMHIRTAWLTSSLEEELKKSFSKELNKNKPHLKLEHGLYYDSIKKYQKVFGEKQVKIIIFEEWIKNPKETLEEILKFLNINHSVLNLPSEPYNKYRGVRGEKIVNYFRSNKISQKIIKKTILPSVRNSLREKIILKEQSKPIIKSHDRETLIKYYKDDVEKVQNLLGHKLSWPNF